MYASIYRVAHPATVRSKAGVSLVSVPQELADEFDAAELRYRELCGKIVALITGSTRDV